MGSSWKLALVFAVLFLTGGLSGSVITYSVLRKQAFPNPTRNLRTWTDNLMQKLQRNGRLTPEQSKKIRPRVEAAVKQMQSIQIQAMQQGSDALDAALAEIETELNPDQQKRMEHFRERRREFLQQAISRRDAQR
jgi:ribosome-associated translation inhibitor RaiA